MRRRRLGFARAIAIGFVVGAVGVVAPAFAAFSSITSNGPNSFSAAPDVSPPSSDRTVIDRTNDCTPGTPGSIGAGGTFYVYADVTDAGSPASGVATVTANVSALTSPPLSAVALVAGSYTVGGLTYNYRTASITASGSLASGTYSFSLTSTDNAGNSNTQTGFTVDVDGSPAPAGTDIQIVNGTGTAGFPDTGDVATFSFSQQILPCSVLSGWAGSSTTVTVQLKDNGGQNDALTVWDSTNTTQLNLGSVDLGPTRGDYTAGVNGARFTGSTMVESGTRIIVTLGTLTFGSVRSASGADTMTWVPSGSATGTSGLPVSTATVTESGSLDREF